MELSHNQIKWKGSRTGQFHIAWQKSEPSLVWRVVFTTFLPLPTRSEGHTLNSHQLTMAPDVQKSDRHHGLLDWDHGWVRYRNHTQNIFRRPMFIFCLKIAIPVVIPAIFANTRSQDWKLNPGIAITNSAGHNHSIFFHNILLLFIQLHCHEP